MILGIDATNIKSEGGIVHLFEILNNYTSHNSKIKKIFIWGNRKVLSKIADNKIIKKNYLKDETYNLFKRIFWQKFILPKELKKNNCTFLFVPGGILLNSNFKSVVVFQNILPFVEDEISRYSLIHRIKFYIQRKVYIYSFKNADGIICLSNFSKKIINKNLYLNKKKISLINHGISNNFKKNKIKIKTKATKLIYVSKLDIYKNQLELIDALHKIKNKMKFKLTLIGDGDYKIKQKILKKINDCDLNEDIKLYKNKNYNTLSKIYNQHDIKIYPSKAETFGLTMLEAIKCGLPILALKSDISKEILSKSGFYYSNLNDDLLKKLLYISKNSKLVKDKIKIGTRLSKNYSWKKTSILTFNFLKQIEKIEK